MSDSSGNYWDASRGEWIDPATGNHMKPTDQGGDGQWHNADNSKILMNGTWVAANGSTGDSTSGAYSPQAGGDYNLQDAQDATAVKLQQMQSDQAKEVANLNNAAQSALQDKINGLQEQLKSQDITEAQYELAKTQAETESQFSRQLALDQLKEQHSYELQSQNNDIARAAEARQERSTEAALGANPTDWVAYELYQRQMAAPNAITLSNPSGGSSGGTSPSSSSGTQTQLNGSPYDNAPPAYDDSSIQAMANGLFNPNPSGYNPNEHGTGVFGTTINAPNQLSRSQYGNLSDTEMGLLTGLLKAGITQPNGQRVAINPTDYFTQSQNGWVPTLSGGSPNTPTQYS